MKIKSSKQNSTNEENERQKRRQQEKEEEIKIELTLKGQENKQERIEENKETKKQDKQEEDKSYLGATIKDSIWAPNKREYRQGESYIANISIYSVPEETEKERIRYIKFELAGNKHLKDVQKKQPMDRGKI